MHRHFTTALILLGAVALYALGYAGLGVAALIAGFVFEIWFWFRVKAGRAWKDDAGRTSSN